MLLEFNNVTGTNKGFSLQNISFKLPKGYIMGLAGKNGAGKTTLIDYIMNPKKCYEGQILLNGMDIHTNHCEILNDIGFVSEDNTFLLDRSAAQNAKILGTLYNNWNMKLFNETMNQFSLPTNRVVGKMSRGEKMKFQLAFAIAHKPTLYILDEATAGMDPVFRVDLFKMLQALLEDEKTSILMTTHIQTEMEQKTDYIGILENGRLTSFGC